MKYSELLRLLTKDGWYSIRQKGTSHMMMAHPTKKGRFPFPVHGAKEIGKKLEHEIKKQAGLK